MTPEHEARPYRLVVADDSTVFRASLVRFLNTLPDIEVVAEAGNGREALELLEQLAPDILILDIQMPVMDGLAVLQRLQATETTTQVLVLSAHGDNYAQQVIASGIAVFVPKGDIARLRQTLTMLINERSKD
jgi:YesN/AraC family two-component response regulator